MLPGALAFHRVYVLRGAGAGTSSAGAQWVTAGRLQAHSTELLSCVGLPSSSGHPTVIEMVYSLGKAGWIEQAADRFARLCPEHPGGAGADGGSGGDQRNLDGEMHPTIWSPANELSISHLSIAAASGRPSGRTR